MKQRDFKNEVDMKGYIDLFLLPVPKKELAAYKKLAAKFSKIIQEHGALEYREFLGDDLNPKHGTPFPSKIKLKPGEVLVSSVIEFRSKAHRDQVNKKAMADPRMQQMCKEELPFDVKRMLYGGFSTIVKMKTT